MQASAHKCVQTGMGTDKAATAIDGVESALSVDITRDFTIPLAPTKRKLEHIFRCKNPVHCPGV